MLSIDMFSDLFGACIEQEWKYVGFFAFYHQLLIRAGLRENCLFSISWRMIGTFISSLFYISITLGNSCYLIILAEVKAFRKYTLRVLAAKLAVISPLEKV